MATLILKDARVELNSVNISAWVKTVKLTKNRAIKETTAMTESSFSGLPGLRDWGVDLEMNQDMGSGGPDATLAAIDALDAAVAIKVRITSGAISATNPEYQGNVLLESYGPISGSRGDVAGVSAKLRGTGDLTRATSA